MRQSAPVFLFCHSTKKAYLCTRKEYAHNMKRRFVIALATVILTVLTIGCNGHGIGPGHTPRPDDTLYTAEAADTIYAYNPERALAIIDSAELVDNIDHNSASFMRAKIYSMSLFEQRYDTALLICESLMEDDYVDDPKKKEAVLDLLVYITRQMNDNEQYLRWATEKAMLCQQQGDNVEMMRTQAEIGYVFVRLGESEKGLSILNAITAALSNPSHFSQLDAYVIALRRTIDALTILDRYEESIPLAIRVIEKLEDFRQHSDLYADGSNRIPPDAKHIEDYCDFYTAQAHAKLAYAYAATEQADSAHRHLALYRKSRTSQTLGGKKTIVPTLCMLGDYTEMLAICNEAEASMGDDTVNDNYAVILFSRATAAEARGNYHAAADYWHRYANINKQINNNLLESQTHEYAMRYHLQEERIAAERERTKARFTGQLALVLLVFALAATILIVRLLIQRRSIDRKNKILTNQIAEAMKYKQMYEAAKTTSKTTNLDILNDEQLFEYLNDTIRRERLFLKPDCGRQTLIDRFHITDRRIGAVFAQSSYSSLPDFIRELRLEHACQLLAAKPEMSISDVASASGFSSLTVFGRDFKRKYEVTPTYYKNTAAKGKKED